MTIDLDTYAKPYVRLQDLAGLLGISPRTVYHHIEKGTLKAVKIGGLLRIPIAEARKYAAGTPRPPNDPDGPLP